MTSSIPSTTLFITTLVTGTLVTMSSSHWIFVWAGLEINLLSFIPLMVQSNSNQETEAAIKYFLVQALGSGLLLMAGLLISGPALTLISPSMTSLLLMMSMLIKMGAAPFHFWFPQVMACSSWYICIILSTWQKLAPILVFSSITSSFSTNLIMFMAGLNSMIGGIGGINQTQIRALLAYSSIGHMGWIISAALISQSLTMLYLIIYMLISSSLMLSFYMSNFKLRNTTSMNKMNKNSLWISMLLLLSLGGLPPLLGFIPKWALLEQLMGQTYTTLSIILIIGSLMNLFYYLTIVMNLFMASPAVTYNTLKTSFNPLGPTALFTLSVAPTMFML
nr:NADH dehydrogenase subunit 2 [Micropodarke fujianensis]